MCSSVLIIIIHTNDLLLARIFIILSSTEALLTHMVIMAVMTNRAHECATVCNVLYNC